MLIFPSEFYNGVVETYWDQIDFAGQRLTGTYSDMVTVPANGVLPMAGDRNPGSLARQANVYMNEVVSLFLRKEGKTSVFLDWDKKIRRARWMETKEPPTLPAFSGNTSTGCTTALLTESVGWMELAVAYRLCRGQWETKFSPTAPPSTSS